MIVLKPTQITDAMLTSSIPEPDAGEVVWTAGTYSTGERRINTTTHKIYEVIASPSTTDDPIVGVNADPPTWIEIGPTNRWAMFNGVIADKSTATDSMAVTIEPGTLFNGVAAFGISNVSAVTITMTDPVAGVVYSRDVDMNDYDEISDFYDYFFEPITRRTEFAYFDLPAYVNASLTVAASGSGTIAIGELITGRQISLGVATYGASFKLLDFSRKEKDEFGRFTITPRRTSKLTDFDFVVLKSRTGYVFNQLSQLTTVPCVYAGEPESDFDSTITYGYYVDATINIETPSYNKCTLQIEGLT